MRISDWSSDVCSSDLGKITALVEARLALLAPNRESLRRAIAILALPRHVIRAGKLGWRAADVMWRAAGDKATDYNHYTKRAMLGGISTAPITVFLADDSHGWAEPPPLLPRRIHGIMPVEKAQAALLTRPAK